MKETIGTKIQMIDLLIPLMMQGGTLVTIDIIKILFNIVSDVQINPIEHALDSLVQYAGDWTTSRIIILRFLTFKGIGKLIMAP